MLQFGFVLNLTCLSKMNVVIVKQTELYHHVTSQCQQTPPPSPQKNTGLAHMFLILKVLSPTSLVLEQNSQSSQYLKTNKKNKEG